MLRFVDRLRRLRYPYVAGYKKADAETCFRLASQHPFASQYEVASLQNMRFPLPDHLSDLLRMLSHFESPKVLVVGCGAGYSRRALELSNVHCDYYGCDIDDKALAVARDFFKDDRFFHADAVSLPFEAQAFDVCVMEGSLQYIRNYEEAISEAARVGASLIINRATMTSGSRDLHYIRTGHYINGVIAEIHISEPKLIALLEGHGLRAHESVTLSKRRIDGGEVCILKSYLCLPVAPSATELT